MFAFLQTLFPFHEGSARRSAIRALRRMPARQREDLGISPDQIEAVVDAMMRRQAVAALPERPRPITARLPTATTGALAGTNLQGCG